MAKFFSGVFNYVFNEPLVDTLANSRAFQSLAVRTDKALREAQASGKLTDVAKAPGEAAKTATEYGRAVWDELTRQAAEMERNAKQKAGGGSDQDLLPPRPPPLTDVRSAQANIILVIRRYSYLRRYRLFFSGPTRVVSSNSSNAFTDPRPGRPPPGGTGTPSRPASSSARWGSSCRGRIPAARDSRVGG